MLIHYLQIATDPLSLPGENTAWLSKDFKVDSKMVVVVTAMFVVAMVGAEVVVVVAIQSP